LTFSGQDLSCIRGERVVFQNLSFSISSGDALILRGPNGSGKSTLLRLAAGLLKPAIGSLSWQGDEAASDDYHDKIHYVGHLDAVKAAFTVQENLAFWCAFEGSPTVEADCAAALDRLGLSHIADVPGRYLSAGQRRRLNIARIAATAKPLWLLDEPSVSLDDASVARLVDLIADHRRSGGMVMVATHIDLALEGADTLHLASAQAEQAA